MLTLRTILLLAGSGDVRLAPSYDVTSALPYKNLNQEKLSLAMKLGNHYRLRDISFHDWEKPAKAARMDSDRLFGRINAMIDELPGKAMEVLSGARRSQLSHSLLKRLVADLAARAAACKGIVAHRKSAMASRLLVRSAAPRDGILRKRKLRQAFHSPLRTRLRAGRLRTNYL